MILNRPFRLIFALCALAALPALSACHGADEDMDDSTPPQNIQQTPPDPQVEITPMIEDPQTQIWRPGYWALSGQSFTWVSGKVIPRPSPTAVWAGAHWVQHEYGWSFVMGHWE